MKWTEWVAEARRRRVFRTAGVYLVAVWGISQGAVELAPLFGASDWMLRTALIAAIAALPGVVVLAWMFEIGRDGIVRDPQDVLAQQQADQELAAMPTVLGGDVGAGAIVVRFREGEEERSLLCVDEFFVGRGADCRVRFYDPLVSRRHARVFPDQEGWVIEDLGSRNGTRVDGVPIERLTLAATSEIRVNDAGPALRFEWLPAGPAARNAIASFPPTPQTAHIRLAGDDVTRGRTPSGWKRGGA